MEQENELGVKPIKKLLWKLAVPAITAQIVNVLYNVVDRIYIGHIPEEGELALAGLGITFPIIMLVTAVQCLISVGGSTQAAVAMGAGDQERAQKTFGGSAVLLTAGGALLTVLVVVLLTNAYNLIDGIDGLCSGLSILALFTFGVWFLTHHIYVYAMMSMAMGGVVTIFFFYNVMGHRMKIFMGDTGSLLLGFVIAFLGLKFYDLNINGEFYRIDAAPAVFLGIVFIPAFDTVRVFCVRMAAGLSPFYPDRRHIHHKLLRIGLTHLQGTLVIVVLQACFILLNFLLRNFNIIKSHQDDKTCKSAV